MNPIIQLKPNREKSLLHRHPWIFSGAIQHLPDHITPGQTVDVVTSKNEFIARGAFSPHSQIAVRVWTFDEAECVDEQFFAVRISDALKRRKRYLTHWSTNAYRMVNAESDGLPGVVVDCYDDYLVVQFLSAGADLWKRAIVDQIMQLAPSRGIFERSDVDVRMKEGLEMAKGTLAGTPPPDLIEIHEGGLKFLVDVINGHKTGFYLDQRENRQQIVNHSMEADVLNCFAYSGAFGLYALRGGAARITNIELSPAALALSERHGAINGIDHDKVDNIQDDVFKALRRFRNEERRFDLIVLDPPKFAESRSQLNHSLRGYKDINWLAFRLLNPGGYLYTFSCSGLVDAALFQKVVSDGALDAGRQASIIQRMEQAGDHPVSLNFPEGSYLKGLVCLAD